MRGHRRMFVLILLASGGIGALLWERTVRVAKPPSVEIHKLVLECDSHPFAGMMQEAFDNMRADLKANDDLEFELLVQAVKGKTIGRQPKITIVLIRPDEILESRETYEFRNDDQGFVIKMVKIKTKRIVGPVAVIITAAVDEGKLLTEHMALRYGDDGRWSEFSPSQ
jgi:hypothetical protein